MTRVKKKLVDFVEYRAILWVARILYVAGLTSLIPLAPLIFAPDQLWNVRAAIVLAFALILVSFIIIFWFTRSKRESIQALGFMTLIPGLLAVLFAYFGDRVFAAVVDDFGPASPLVRTWLDHYVPRSWLLAGIYVLIGTGLLYLSQNVRR